MFFHNFSKYDVIVTKLTSQVIERKNPQGYSTNDVQKGVDGLYIAVQKKHAPKWDEEVVIGTGITDRKRRDLGGKYSIYNFTLK